MLMISGVLLLAALIQVVLALMVWLGGRGSKLPSRKLFVALSLSILSFTLCSVLLLFAAQYADLNNVHIFNTVNKLAFMLGVCVILLVYIFSLIYPVKRRFNRNQKLIIAAGVLLIFLSPFKFVAGSFTYPGHTVYTLGSLSILIAIFGLLVLVAFYIHNLKLMHSDLERPLKNQVRTVRVGLSLTITHALIFMVLLPWIFGDHVLFYAIGYFAPFYFSGFIAYSLLKQNLFNVRLIVARTIAYALSLGIITITFSILIFGFSGAVLESHFPLLVQRLFYVFVIILLSLAYQPLKRFFDKWTNKLFYRDAYDPQIMLDELNSGLVSTIELERLLTIASRIVSGNLKAQYCSFLIGKSSQGYRLFGKVKGNLPEENIAHIAEALYKNSHKVMLSNNLSKGSSKLQDLLSSQDIMAVSKLDTHAGAIGYMLLGDKKSGSAYTSQDAKIIEIISDELAIATQNALRFEEIKRFNVTLQEKVDEATKELRQANQRLKQLDQTKDEFISMASHQLRTPLTTIKGYLSMVLEGDVGPVTKSEREMIQHAFDGAERMVFLIGDLLNVSRLQSGKFVIENKITDLNKMIADEIIQLQETAKNHRLTLSYKAPEKFPLLNIDETKIRQVIMNFIDNAIYYTPQGGSITVALRATDREILFTVTDTGLGVPKEAQHHLFSKFYRAGNARKMRPDGTGLGLFMAKKVITAQGGAIIFNSVEGKGSTFGFSIPRSKVELKGNPSDNPKETAVAA